MNYQKITPVQKKTDQNESAHPHHVDTLIISDIHLGSDVSRAEAALAMLKRYHFNRLILLGDIFDDLNFNRLTHTHWDLISYIRLLSNPSRGVNVVWVYGNHDEKLFMIMQYLIGIKVRKEYLWDHHGEKYYAIHGHQFDYFLVRNRFISDIATVIYNIFQKLDTKNHWISHHLKRLSKKWLRVSKNVALGAVRYSKKYHAHYVFCGHTHQAAEWEIKGVKYYNTGCWTDTPSAYVTIGDGGVRLYKTDEAHT